MSEFWATSQGFKRNTVCSRPQIVHHYIDVKGKAKAELNMKSLKSTELNQRELKIWISTANFEKKKKKTLRFRRLISRSHHFIRRRKRKWGKSQIPAVLPFHDRRERSALGERLPPRRTRGRDPEGEGIQRRPDSSATEGREGVASGTFLRFHGVRRTGDWPYEDTSSRNHWDSSEIDHLSLSSLSLLSLYSTETMLHLLPVPGPCPSTQHKTLDQFTAMPWLRPDMSKFGVWYIRKVTWSSLIWLGLGLG